MKRSVLLAVGLASLFLGHGGYAEKTRVDPSTAQLGQYGSLGLVGVQSDGRFIVGGNFDIIDSQLDKRFARMTADGRLDSSWGNVTAYSSLVMDGDDVYAAWADSAGNRNVSKLNEHGGVGTNWVYTTQTNLEVVGVNSTGVFVVNDGTLVKINKQTGAADWSYAITNDYLGVLFAENAIFINEGRRNSNSLIGKLNDASGNCEWVADIGGDYTVVDGMALDGMSLYYALHTGLFGPDFYISRIDIANGVLDTNWICNADSFITSLAVDNTGVYAGGQFSQIGGAARSGLAKIDKASAQPITNWDVAVPGLSVTAFQTNDTSIYTIGSGGGNFLAKVNKTTAGIDWAIPLNDYNPVNFILTQASIFLCATNSDSTMTYFAKFDKPTGAMHAFFGEHSCYYSGSAYCLARQSDGKFYISGDFQEINGSPHAGFARLNANGSVDNGWRCDDKSTDIIAVDDTGLYVDFSGGDWCGGWGVITKLTKSSGAAATKWEYRIDNYWRNRGSPIRAITVDNESVYIGGWFDSTLTVITAHTYSN